MPLMRSMPDLGWETPILPGASEETIRVTLSHTVPFLRVCLENVQNGDGILGNGFPQRLGQLTSIAGTASEKGLKLPRFHRPRGQGRGMKKRKSPRSIWILNGKGEEKKERYKEELL